MASKIEPIMLPRARTLVERHRTRGDDLLVITATNRFITEPIALAMGIPDIIACEPEIVDGLYSGEPTGIPSYREGKVERLHQWLEGRGSAGILSVIPPGKRPWKSLP